MVQPDKTRHDELQQEIDRIGRAVSRYPDREVKIQVGFSIMLAHGSKKKPYEHVAKIARIAGTKFWVSETGFLVQTSSTDYFTVRVESLDSPSVESLINALRLMP
ncbi:MAG: hypothetical protein L0H36_00915 [bacterium]|nr:hypothetical protein [bacterium]MDN5835178.1 hypothetical protein [bacterium]